VRGPVVAAAAVAAALVPGWAAAAPDPLTSKHVASGSAAVSSCGSLSGVSVSWTSRNGVITQVVLGSIPSTCIGGTLSLTFAGTGNSSLGTAGPVAVSATSMTLAVSGSPTASAISLAHIAVVGP
jgi:hypothetical protein